MSAAQHTPGPSIRTFINVRVGGLMARLETTHCFWCRDRGVCGACYSTTERMRASLARTAAKRDSRAKATGQEGGDA